MMILKPCRHAGCNQLTERRDGLCLAHSRSERNNRLKQYPTSSQRGYGGRWPMIRKAKLARDPFCEHCQEAGRVTLASLVHHGDRNTSNNAPENLVSLCQRCHAIEHSGELFGRRAESEATGGGSEISEENAKE